jgi:hypothetical protein
MKKILIPIEIKTEKDLPKKEGMYHIDYGYCYFKQGIFYVNTHLGSYPVKASFWYKEVSEKEYKKEISIFKIKSLQNALDFCNKMYNELAEEKYN